MTIVCLSPIASKLPQGDKLKKSESNQFSLVGVLLVDEDESKYLDVLLSFFSHPQLSFDQSD